MASRRGTTGPRTTNGRPEPEGSGRPWMRWASALPDAEAERALLGVAVVRAHPPADRIPARREVLREGRAQALPAVDEAARLRRDGRAVRVVDGDQARDDGLAEAHVDRADVRDGRGFPGRRAEHGSVGERGGRGDAGGEDGAERGDATDAACGHEWWFLDRMWRGRDGGGRPGRPPAVRFGRPPTRSPG